MSLPVTRGRFNLFFAFRSRVSRLVPRADNAGENSRRIIESITIAVRNDHLKPTELQFRNPRNTSGNTATFHTRSRFSVVAEPATSCAARGLDRPKTGHCFFFFYLYIFAILVIIRVSMAWCKPEKYYFDEQCD